MDWIVGFMGGLRERGSMLLGAPSPSLSPVGLGENPRGEFPETK